MASGCVMASGAMYSGVPVIASLAADSTRFPPKFFTRPKSTHLDDIGLVGSIGEDDVGRLDVAMDQAERVGLGESAADLGEDVDRARGLDGSVLIDEALEVQAVEILHDVIEGAVGRSPVVEDRDRVRVYEAARQLHFALEAHQVGLTRAILEQQLDRRRPTKHGVRGAIDDTHRAFTDLAFEHVLPEPARLADLRPETVDDPRGDGAREGRDGPHHDRRRRKRARIGRTPGESSTDGRHEDTGQKDLRDPDHGRDDDRATRG